MNRTERFYKIDQLLQERKAVPMVVLMDELQVSRATIKRDLEYLRDRFNAPLIWDRSLGGYRYETDDSTGPRYALPGLWFNASEVHALLSMEHLLSNLQPGLLGPHIEPLRTRIRALLDSGDHSAEEIVERIRVLHMAARDVDASHFQLIAAGILGRKRLRIRHYNRAKDETLQRDVSPQRLVYYRDNWYLDAWCHVRHGLRSFSVDAINEIHSLPTAAKNVAAKVLTAELGAGYGIFAGQDTKKVLLRFTPERARWIAQEEWHPAQESEFDDDGYYLLSFPYTNDTELIMDIMRYGPDVEVLEPTELREKVRARFGQARAVYDAKS